MNIKNYYSEQFSSLNELFITYRKTNRCLAAFNINDLYDLKALVLAANQLDTHVMAMTYPPVVELLTPKVVISMIDGMRTLAKNKLYIHLDHSTSVDLCKQAIDCGYDSVMIDGSQLPIEENIKITKQVTRYAESTNVVVEAEVGKILGRGFKTKSDEDFLAEPSDVKRLYEEANPNIIAVGIGTAHGFTPVKPKIHFDRLQSIAEIIPTPLVLHGGTGIPDADIQKAIKLGISKINIGTIVHSTYMKHTQKEIKEAGEEAYPPFIMKKVIPEIQKVIMDRIKVINTN